MNLSAPNPPASPLEMWGGVECSHVRVRTGLRNQLELTGHAHRLEDLDRIATLGITTLRYPVLWEHHATDPIDWRWADERLNRLRELGIRPIVGFVHHGSGALRDGLLDPRFAPALAAFARRFAERFPWVDAYTPVNEPATTARFSGLYGVWHPFRQDMHSFGLCFLHECLGIREAMKAVRAVNPAAQLVQTEDVGKIHSTPRLTYQADYENERRWLTFDVLCGRIDPTHGVHAHLLDCGISAEQLESFVSDPCPPDILGMNHYVTSERLLDERLDRYPRCTHGGNGREAYADVDAVRVRAEGLVGMRGLLQELWARYRRPIAITEVQLACTRDEQVRWLMEAWAQASAARAEGVDVRAITAWALFGAYDWDSLLVHAAGHYENGAFDVRGPEPRRTAVGAAISRLAHRRPVEHPVLVTPGWWRRPVRFEYPPVSTPATGAGTALAREPEPSGPPLLLVGAGGTLGRAFQQLCALRGLATVALTRQQLDATDPLAVKSTLARHRPWAVINCAGYVRVDDAEQARTECTRLNTLAAANLAEACASLGARLVTFSTDLVFDGTLSRRYVETDPPHPLNHYGRTKWESEQRVLATHPSALVVRTSSFFGPWDDYNFAVLTLRSLLEGRHVYASRDVTVSPTYVPDLVHATLDLLIDEEAGVWHLANEGAVTWFDWARAIATAIEAPAELVLPATPQQLGWRAQRPRYSALGTARGTLLRPWTDALDGFLSSMPAAQAEAAA